ncbi:MAG: hypothetical protein VW828_02670, partial [Candidatus Puniceispirillum sp.]
MKSPLIASHLVCLAVPLWLFVTTCFCSLGCAKSIISGQETVGDATPPPWLSRQGVIAKAGLACVAIVVLADSTVSTATKVVNASYIGLAQIADRN